GLKPRNREVSTVTGVGVRRNRGPPGEPPRARRPRPCDMRHFPFGAAQVTTGQGLPSSRSVTTPVDTSSTLLPAADNHPNPPRRRRTGGRGRAGGPAPEGVIRP